VGCAPTSTDDVITPLPTLTLIVIPPTQTPLPPTLTPTLQAELFRPSDLVTPTPFNQANEMAQLASMDVGLENVDVAYIEARTWRNSQTLDCDETASSPARGEPNGYEIILLAGRDVYVYHTDQEATVIQCATMPITDVSGDLLIKFDSTAADLFSLAQRDLADRLNVSTRRVTLQEMQMTVWQDSSLGCPRDGQTYTEIRITGYRILLTDGTETYAYHTDFDRALPCPIIPKIT
jgi:hypothetical protein